MNLTIDELKRIARWSFHFDDTDPEDLALYDKIMRTLAERETLDQWERSQRGSNIPCLTGEQEGVLLYLKDHPLSSMADISLVLNVSVVVLSRSLLSLSRARLILPNHDESRVRWTVSDSLVYSVKPYS